MSIERYFGAEELEVTKTINITGGDNPIDFSNLTVGTATDGSLIKAGTFSSRVTFSTASQFALKFYLENTATSGTFTGMRLRANTDSASGTPSVTTAEIIASVDDSRDAGTLNAIDAEMVPKGTNTITTARCILANADSAASQTVTTQIIGHFRVHTRGDETITNDEMLRLENEAVGGNGRQLDSYINITTTNLSGGILGAGYLIDAGTATDVLATAILRVGDDTTTAWDTQTTGTASGALKVVVGTATRYIALYSDSPS